MDRRQILIAGGCLAGLGAGTVGLVATQMGSASEYNDAVRSMRAVLA